jgi:hypothetical protein
VYNSHPWDPEKVAVVQRLAQIFLVMKNWKEAATNTAYMFKCLFSCNIFHLMKKTPSRNKQFLQKNLHNKIDQ